MIEVELKYKLKGNEVNKSHLNELVSTLAAVVVLAVVVASMLAAVALSSLAFLPPETETYVRVCAWVFGW